MCCILATMKDTKTVTIRIRTELYDAIKKQADKENRSFNNMVETLLLNPDEINWDISTWNNLPY